MLIIAAIFLLSSLVCAQVNLDDVNDGCLPGGCSGHGDCVLQVCVCDNLWSSNSDFIIVQDCTLSYIGIYVLWLITLILSLHVVYKTSWVVAARFENFFVQKKAVKGYTLWKNPGLISVIFLYSLAIPSVIIMAVLHLVNPSTRIAFDYFPTVLFFLGKAGLYCGAAFLQGPLLVVALKGEHAFDSLVRFNYRFNFFINSLSMLTGVFPFITLVYYQTNIPKQFEVIRAYYFCQAIVLALQFTEAYFVKLRLNFVLNRAANMLSSEKTSSILDKVNAVQNAITRQAAVQCVLNVLMGSIPYLLNKHAYFLPISWIAIPIIGKNIALQINLDKAGTKTIAQRFKMLMGGTTQTSTPDPNSPSVNAGNAPPDVTSGKVGAASEHAILSTSYVMEAQNPLRKVQSQNSQVSAMDTMEDARSGESGEKRKKFDDFLIARYASGSRNLYDAIIKYEKCEKELLKSHGEAIMRTFILDSAPEAIDLPHEVKDKLLMVYKTGSYKHDTFETAKGIAFDVLE